MENEYINRLVGCGIDPCEAYLIYHSFKTNYKFSDKELEELIDSMESEKKRRCGSITILIQ